MPITLEATTRQKKYVAKLLETGNGTQAAMEAYNVTSRQSAGEISSQNLRKLKVQELIASHAEFAASRVRQLSGQEKNLPVALGASKDILDRAGDRPPEPEVVHKTDITLGVVILPSRNDT